MAAQQYEMFRASDLRAVLANGRCTRDRPYDIIEPEIGQLNGYTEWIHRDLLRHIRTCLAEWWEDLFTNSSFRSIYVYLGRSYPQDWPAMRRALVAHGYTCQVWQRNTGIWVQLGI